MDLTRTRAIQPKRTLIKLKKTCLAEYTESRLSPFAFARTSARASAKLSGKEKTQEKVAIRNNQRG